MLTLDKIYLAVYSHVDRMVTLGCMPVNEVVALITKSAR